MTTQVSEEEEVVLQRFRETKAEYLKSQRTPKYGESPPSDELSLGETLVASAGYRDWLTRFPDGAPSVEGDYRADPVKSFHRFGAGRKTARKALVTSQDASAGSLIPSQFRGLLEPGLVRPLTLRELVTVQPTNSDTVEYVREKSRSYAAAPIEEATALTGTTGTKPQSGIDFEKKTVPVRTFAVWVPVTNRVIADAEGLRSYVDQFLTDDLELEVEDQILGGDGTGENFMGILNDADVQAQGADSGPLYALRKARRLVLVNARTMPTAVVANPADVEQWDLAVVNSESNHFLGDPFGRVGQRTVWGMPIVETDAVPENTAIVGDFRRAVVFDRRQTTITVGTVGEDFIRNIVRVLAEQRLGFAILRPKAFCKVTV